MKIPEQIPNEKVKKSSWPTVYLGMWKQDLNDRINDNEDIEAGDLEILIVDVFDVNAPWKPVIVRDIWGGTFKIDEYVFFYGPFTKDDLGK